MLSGYVAAQQGASRISTMLNRYGRKQGKGLNGLQLEPSVDGSILALWSCLHTLRPGTGSFRATEEVVWRAGDDARPLI